MKPFKQYKRKGLSEMRPYIPGEDLSKVSVSLEDTTEEGGMVARNPQNHDDQWYVAKKYFEENLEEAGPVNFAKRFDFGLALCALEQGKRVAREGWNGKGMFIFLLPGNDVPKSVLNDPALIKVVNEKIPGDTFPALPSIRMFPRDGNGRYAILTGWAASQSDMFAKDWVIIE